MALEFASAVSRLLASTLLPVVVVDLDAREQLALLVAGSTLGLFVALPVAGRSVRLLGRSGVLGVGVLAYVGGLVLAATATRAWVFALGQFAGGLASGLLAIFGVSAAIRHLDEGLRVRVVAASSAMWIAPALIGPAATLGVEHLIGWRWTLLTPIPVVLIGRLLVARSLRDEPPEAGPSPPLGRTMLVPLGAAGIVFGTTCWPVAAVGAVLAVIGVTAMLPSGTARLARGTPAALAAMTLFAIGYFGADSLITVLLTAGYHTGLARAAIVLGAAPLAWALTSLATSRFLSDTTKRWFPAVGLALSTLGVASVAIGTFVAPVFAVALLGWTLTGAGVGLAYPILYVLATTAGTSGLDAAGLAAAVITAEAFGALLGSAAGGAIGSHADAIGLGTAYLVFTVSLAAAGYAATRSTADRRPDQRRGPCPRTT